MNNNDDYISLQLIDDIHLALAWKDDEATSDEVLDRLVTLVKAETELKHLEDRIDYLCTCIDRLQEENYELKTKIESKSKKKSKETGIQLELPF